MESNERKGLDVTKIWDFLLHMRPPFSKAWERDCIWHITETAGAPYGLEIWSKEKNRFH